MTDTNTIDGDLRSGALQTAEAAERHRAYSYIRFSTPDQAKGDSLDRQTRRARAYAELHGLELDTELKLEDRGVSAFRSTHAKTGALSGFLKAVNDGLVPAGSYLLIENIDRLTRDDIIEATELFLSIIRAGIVVVTLTNGFPYSRESLKSDPYAMFQIVMELIRANQESVRKSDLLSQAYLRKRRDAAQRTENKPFTRMLPAWLTYDAEARGVVAIQERADTIRSIFKMAEKGLGQHAIAQRLNAEGVPTFGGLGKQRKADAWHRSYVRKLLTNSAVVGTFTPHQRRTDTQGNRKRVPLDPVEGYFPAIVERDLFERVTSRLRATAARGRNAAAETKSIFAGLIQCAHCGGTVTRMVKGPDNVYLICSRVNRKLGCKRQAVRYEDAERALVENATSIVQEAPRGLDTDDIDQQITGLDEAVSELTDKARELVDELIREKTNAKRAELRAKERELEEAREKLRSLRARKDTLASPYVLGRLRALEQALTHKPLNVMEANKALKEAVSRIVINPETAELLLHWHHALEQPTDAGPFQSRHYRGFEASPVDTGN
jgi:DNA invertase Pin-like site-specific DNA recombinase